jgi:LysR family pca operon transcriptional activator
MPLAVQSFMDERTGSPIKVVTGENLVLLEQLRIGQLDVMVGRLAAPEQMTGLSFEHLYSEPIRFVVRPDHPLLRQKRFDFTRVRDYTILMPTRGSIIRPFAERFLLVHGIAELPSEIETVSDSFGRALLAQSDAIWIISEGAVARDLKDGTLAALPVDTSETRGSVGLTTRSGADPSSSVQIFARMLRETVRTLGL